MEGNKKCLELARAMFLCYSSIMPSGKSLEFARWIASTFDSIKKKQA